MILDLPAPVKRYGLALFERGLPMAAGVALALSGGGELEFLMGLVLASVAVAAAAGTGRGEPFSDAALFGLAPAVLGYGLTAGSVDALSDPALWCIALPFAVYAANPALVSSARIGSPMLFAMLNTLALAALALPVVTGRIHWAIAILPFAAFRVAATTAEKLRPGDEFAEGRREASEIARKILWISGAWIAGWAGITP